MPYFATFINGEWDFRVIRPELRRDCMKKHLCWLCGQRLGQLKAFVVGPMCVVTRTSAEPPCHYSCARYGALACPFLAAPRMKRNEKDLPDERKPPPGIAIMRNPGVAAVLITRNWKPFSDGNGGVLIQMGEPERVEWFAQRREATRAEVDESIRTGLPILEAEADAEGPDASEELIKYIASAQRWLPQESAR